MATASPNAPARRGGVSTKINRQNEFRARNIAADWRSRNIDLAQRPELERVRDALYELGVVISPNYSATARLLAVICARLLVLPE